MCFYFLGEAKRSEATDMEIGLKSQLSHSQALEGFLPATNLDRRTSMVFSIKSWPVLTFDREAAALKSRNKVLCKTFFEELIVTVQSTKSLSHDQLFFRVPTRNLKQSFIFRKKKSAINKCWLR